VAHFASICQYLCVKIVLC